MLMLNIKICRALLHWHGIKMNVIIVAIDKQFIGNISHLPYSYMDKELDVKIVIHYKPEVSLVGTEFVKNFDLHIHTNQTQVVSICLYCQMAIGVFLNSLMSLEHIHSIRK